MHSSFVTQTDAAHHSWHQPDGMVGDDDGSCVDEYRGSGVL